MKKLVTKQKRALAIDPTTRGMGFAILEGAESLVDWGVKHAEGDKNDGCLEHVSRLIKRFRPDIIVIEDVAGSRRGSRVNQLLGMAAKLCTEQGIAVRRVDRAA